MARCGSNVVLTAIRLLEVLFWSSCAVIAFVYVGYPLVLVLMGLIYRRRVEKSDTFQPFVSIVISAFNEQEHLAATIANKLALEYPSNRREILVASDGSTDGTDEIIQSFAGQAVRYLRQEPRQGKSAALNRLVAAAKGEIIVVSDANSIYQKESIGRLVRNFADPSVGYVTGKMVYVDETGSTIGSGCSAYMQYENVLRKLETRIGSVIGVDGGIDAFRATLYSPLAASALPDFVIPLRVIELGNRVVFDEDALLNECTLSDRKDEWRMRTRVILRAFHALWEMKSLLNPSLYPLISFQLIVHKVLRYLVGMFQIVALSTNILLAPTSNAYLILLVMQMAFYSLAILGAFSFGRFVPGAAYAFYFCLVNASALSALIRFMNGEKQVCWTPRKG